MNLGTNLLIVYIIYFIYTYGQLFINKNKRKEHQNKQQRLDELRLKPIKTDEEQKEFINLKYPKTPPFKWSFLNVGKFILKLGTMIIIFMTARKLWELYIGWLIPLWGTVLIMVFLPMGINKLLKKFNLHQDDLSVFFGGRKK